MDLGIYLDGRNPVPWRRPWIDHYRSTIDRAVEAERLGLGSVWLSEHHLFDDGYLSQPLTLAAAIAARTSRIRIGTAVVLVPLRHVRHLAEEAALVDVVSAGRLELGLGAGYAAPEFELFGADMAARYARTDETVAGLQRLLGDDAFVPPPVQRPVPLWLGYQGPRGARRAGALGVGLLSLDAALAEPYRAGRADAGLDPDDGRMAGVVDVIVADDPPRALDRILPHLAHQLNSYRAAMTAGTGRTPRLLSAGDIRKTMSGPGSVRGLDVLAPDDAARLIRERVQGLPVAYAFCWASIAGMPDDLVDRHIELLATNVAPALRAESL